MFYNNTASLSYSDSERRTKNTLNAISPLHRWRWTLESIFW